MDKRIRRNEICVIGLPSCDFVFSSTRSCFIAYGFDQSVLEMTIIRNLLDKLNIQPVEAGGAIAPGQNAYCTKICSKIIVSQFCIVILNNDINDKKEIPNANINMEYGLMLGFNKYIIPFQRESQTLPFNVAGLDTIKYNDKDFEQKAKAAIEIAIEDTKQNAPTLPSFDSIIQLFIISKKTLVTPLDASGDKDLFNLGSQLGFYLLNDFSGLNYIFLGNFTMLRLELIIWRLKMLKEIIDERRKSLAARIKAAMFTKEQIEIVETILGNLKIWIIVTSDKDKESLLKSLENYKSDYQIEIYSLNEVESELSKIK